MGEEVSLQLIPHLLPIGHVKILDESLVLSPIWHGVPIVTHPLVDVGPDTLLTYPNLGKYSTKLTPRIRLGASEKDDIEIELRCPEADSRGKFGRVLAEVWVCEEGIWTNVNKWMCDNGYAVPYGAENKALVQDLHMANREKVRDQL